MIYPDLTKDRRGYLAWSLVFTAVTFNPQSIAASNNSEKVGSKTASSLFIRLPFLLERFLFK